MRFQLIKLRQKMMRVGVAADLKCLKSNHECNATLETKAERSSQHHAEMKTGSRSGGKKGELRWEKKI